MALIRCGNGNAKELLPINSFAASGATDNIDATPFTTGTAFGTTSMNMYLIRSKGNTSITADSAYTEGFYIDGSGKATRLPFTGATTQTFPIPSDDILIFLYAPSHTVTIS